MATGIPKTLYPNAQNKFSLIFLIVALLNLIAVTTSFKSLFIRTISADSMATSVPEPMAIPTSACTRAGASLIPSPTIATFLFCPCSFFTSFALSSGSTSAKTISIPTDLAIASAVFLLSPVIIATFTFIFLSSSMAALLFSFTVSATAIIPLNLLFIAIYIGVFPSVASLSLSTCNDSIFILFSIINFLFPNKISFPSIVTSIPCPGTALKCSRLLNSKLLSSASLTIASPRGCSDPFSALAAKTNTSSSFIPLQIISVTLGFPSVIVPVLSNTIVSILYVVSKASPPLINTPFSAPFPVPTIIAVGVAKPNAHGHAITSTEINIVKANTLLSPAISHPTAAIIAKAITVGTKYAAMISAILAIGAFVP